MIIPKLTYTEEQFEQFLLELYRTMIVYGKYKEKKDEHSGLTEEDKPGDR